ncbi:MAG: glycosyltransferase family 2 protein [Planctomycetota bacterium]
MARSKPRAPDVSFVMPCYNEEEGVGYSIHQLLKAFDEAGYRIELIAVDNGSVDRTGAIIKEIAKERPEVVYERIEVNEGYGNGLLTGFALCRAPYVGIIAADAQVAAEDVVKLYESLSMAPGKHIAKVRRRFRMDGLRRKLISVAYNLLITAMWPRLGSIDVNGTPKILPRDVLDAMELESRRWFLDPEMMIKAYYMGVRVLEFNVFARMRGSGVSHVNTGTCMEFLRKLLSYRFTRRLADWRDKVRDLPLEDSAGPRGEPLRVEEP